MALTEIQWCRPPSRTGGRRPGYTWNPIRGCEKISRGCKFCYAEKLARRSPKILGEWGADAARVIGSDDNLHLPMGWHRQASAAGERRLVFLGSMMDIGEQRPDLVDAQDWSLSLAEMTPSLDYILTTKRPEGLLVNAERAWGGRWLRNAWPLVTVEGVKELADRRPAIRQLAGRAPVIGLSIEPLLEDIADELEGLLWLLTSLKNRPWIWLIMGGESGKGARPCDMEWFRRIIQAGKRCQLKMADGGRAPGQIRFFVKQLGTAGFDERNGMGGPAVHAPERMKIRRWSGEGGDPHNWPGDLKIREWPVPEEYPTAWVGGEF